MYSNQQFMDVAEHCEDFNSIRKGLVSSANSDKSCYNCTNLRNGECGRGFDNRRLLINEYF